jgi:hypothetical protein
MRVVDHGALPPKPKHHPLQFKRGTASAFKKTNPILLYGEPAFEKDTNKMKIGNGVTSYNDLPYIGDHSKGEDGKSAYDLWLEAGNTGTVDDFLDSLVGESGQSAYEAWLSVGNEGTITDFLIAITGASTYDIWIQAGHEGTMQDFLDDMTGDSAYEVWLKQGHEGTEEDYLAWLCTMSWEEIPEATPEEPDEGSDNTGED